MRRLLYVVGLLAALALVVSGMTAGNAAAVSHGFALLALLAGIAAFRAVP